ncbi:MAG: hypothetical protein HY040_13160 [Planctomycetes bacterium]|nr:hypothetical protein [Planctomycetota bacterium]
MARARLASLSVAAAAALFASGCMTPSCESGGGFFSRFNIFHRNNTPECCCMEGGEFTASSVPVTTEGPVLTVPPQSTTPTGPPPRIITVPQQQAPNVPYSPTGLRK